LLARFNYFINKLCVSFVYEFSLLIDYLFYYYLILILILLLLLLLFFFSFCRFFFYYSSFNSFSQQRTVLSSEAETNKFLDGCQATLLTEAVCPAKELIKHPFLRFHI